MCNVCFKLQHIIQGGTQDLATRREAAAQLRAHYRSQYLDRTVYWNLRFASQTFCDVLVIIIDAMDKTKLATPRYAPGMLP